MKKKEAVRNSTLADGTLDQKCLDLNPNIARDHVEFIPRGITVADNTAFATKIGVHKFLPTDEYYVGIKKGFTDIKDARRETLLTGEREIRSMVISLYGEGSNEYGMFRFTGVNAATDAQLSNIIASVWFAGTHFLTPLEAKGLTQAKLDTLLEDEGFFVTDQRNIVIAERARSLGAYTRITGGNALQDFRALACGIGKNLWYTTDLDKYNDYVMDDGPDAHISTSGALVPDEAKWLVLDVTVGSDAVIATNTHVSTPFEIYFAADVSSPVPPLLKGTVMPDSKRIFPAVSIGYDAVLRPKLIVKDISDSGTSYHVAIG